MWIISLLWTSRNIYGGVRPSSAFRHVLLTLFTSDFDEDVFIKSAVDTRLGATADMISDLVLSQENLDSLK